MEKVYNKMLENISSKNEIFERKFYIEKIEKYINTNLIKVLIGQRRVGKSYIMRTFIQNLVNDFPKNIFYINLEIDDFEELKTREKLKSFFDESFLSKVDISKKIYVFLDEIQEVSEWQTFVNSLLAKFSDKIEIFISGSNSKMLSGELSTYLAGRYVEFLILPFDFCEYKDFLGKTDFIEYLRLTGLPEGLKLSKIGEKEILTNYFVSLKNTILLKDILARHKIKDIYILEKLFYFIIDNIGNFSSVLNIVNKLKQDLLKTNHITIGNYISYLEQTFLIYSVRRYDFRGKKFLESEKKYYINDFGFKNFLISSYDLGLSKSLENYVFLLLKKLGYNIYIGKVGEYEIDFIAEKGEQKKFIQVCFDLSKQEVLDRELQPFFALKDKGDFFLITLGKNFNGANKGIKILDIETFELEIEHNF